MELFIIISVKFVCLLSLPATSIDLLLIAVIINLTK